MSDQVPRPRTKERAPRQPRAKTATTETPDSATSTVRTPADAKLAESVKGMYEGIGVLSMTLGMPRGDERLVNFGLSLVNPTVVGLTAEGAPITPDERTGAEKVTDAWMTCADRNPKVKAALRRFTEGGAFAELIALHVSLLIPFLPGVPGLAFLGSAQNGASVPGV